MSLEQRFSELAIYDAKKFFRMAENFLFNLTDMESKVREATNNDPWGTSVILMAQINAGTFEINQRADIINMLLNRFLEKNGSQWRQIYKSVLLLQYLLINGSTEFVSEVKLNLTLIKNLMLFEFIDDQGYNQSSKISKATERLIELMTDDHLLNDLREKSKNSKHKIFNNMYATSDTKGMDINSGFSTGGLSISADYDSDDENDSQAGTTDVESFNDEHNIKRIYTDETTDVEDCFNDLVKVKDNENFHDFISMPPLVESLSAPITVSNKNNTSNDEEEFTEYVCSKPVEYKSSSSGAPRSVINIGKQLSNDGSLATERLRSIDIDPFYSLYSAVKQAH
ncbi:hypothetical protein TBLA_0B06220 [Henningerozyma blattae CBS 6284]|uniref:ENTH domain-containing protein n=1 Tax=Henningerozyma blattae (strain ATCC 34711 / CBS 6284 / DSM 70876 / NBRC 10599 / NRRL Y-10934 / UCD 77-7) TaxID=1071380 RepID=I2GZ95_HENB6|nr:hypothetical protein TBLA_0B06220 [Tetrapisispora blattae CBS 6284]CCH59447.1 hypothetical protein TBLA_0B06220 [Tetrapisispora blattae CBS 6284]